MAVTYRGTNRSLHRIHHQVNQGLSWLKQTLFPVESSDYIKWRHEFLHKRLSFGLWIGLICFLISASDGFYIFVFNIEQIRVDLDKFYGLPRLAEDLRDITLIGFFLTLGLIAICLLIHRTAWGKRYPEITFLLFAGSVNGFANQLISTFYGIPVKPNVIVFLAFAVLLPLRWPLHLLSQLLPITYYSAVLPLLGITEIGHVSIFNSVYSLGTFIQIGWVCLICNAGVLVYEQLRRSEFESRRELQIFLHAISHDLRSPVMGTSMVVNNLLGKAIDGQVKVRVPILERLLQGSDRQLALINALVAAYHADGPGMRLHCQPLHLSNVVETVLADIEPKLSQNEIELHNSITPDLPLVNADPTHLWRVFSNLIDNALKHNPPGIQLTLETEVLKDEQSFTVCPDRPSLKFQGLSKPFQCESSSLNSLPMLLCRIQDNGIGIPYEQRQRLFELYTRGKRAYYMPGLGLGLYLCKQIVTAHGGEIGVISQLGVGSTFWFTLPLAALTQSPPGEKL